MDAQPQTRIGMPMDEFIRQYDAAPFELVDGERIPLELQVAGQGYVVSLLAEAFFVHERDAERTHFFFHMPFVKVDPAGRVIDSRTPKIIVYETRRWLDYHKIEPDWKDKPLLLAPDLCIEVLSPLDNALDLPAKAARYLNDGVQSVWVFNCRQKFVTVHSKDRSIRLTETDMLDGGDVLPGLSIPIRSLFA